MKIRLLIMAAFIIGAILPAAAQKNVVQTTISLTDNAFYVKNVAAGRYLDLPGYANDAQKQNGSKVKLWDLDDGADRKVKFIPVGNGYYYIRFQHTKSNLDIHGCFSGQYFCGTYKTDNGAEAQIWSAGTSEPQQWKLEQVSPGRFKIINRYSGKVLDASASQIRNNGCKVQQWKWNGTDNQIWELIDVATATRYQQ